MQMSATRTRIHSRAIIAAFVAMMAGVIPTAHSQTASIVVNDMTLAPDAAPHGVPSSYSWGSGNASPQPMPVPAKNWKKQWFQATTAWEQVYIPTTGSTATNTRCQIRNMVTKFLLKNGKWVTVQSSLKPQGAAFVEDFANNSSIDAGARDEATNGGGLSVVVGVGAWTGHNYHFWPVGERATVDIENVIGIYTSCEARLIVDDPNRPDDRSRCKNILQMGADWWLDKKAGWLPDWSANSGIGSTRAKSVTSFWQTFHFCTLPASAILANPPVGSKKTTRTSKRSAVRISARRLARKPRTYRY